MNEAVKPAAGPLTWSGEPARKPKNSKGHDPGQSEPCEASMALMGFETPKPP